MMLHSIPSSHWATWGIVAAATGTVILRPGKWPEALWAVLGALTLIVAGLLPLQSAIHAVGKGVDVYLFLTGMMLVAEVARREALFDFMAAWAVRLARGEPTRLFIGVYSIGVLVTIFMSNDATAIVLTPAVYAAAKKAGAKPLPYLLACAFVANAASFVLPISNPANLVIFGAHMPALMAWISTFALASLASIVVTFAMLRWLQRDDLIGHIERDLVTPELSDTGRLAAWGLAFMALVLLAASALAAPLGPATLLTAALVTLAVALRKRESPAVLLRGVSWSVLALVAGLFVLVEALVHTGVVALLGHAVNRVTALSPDGSAPGLSVLVAVACNLINNLPAGLIAGFTLNEAGASTLIRSAVTVGIDLGPNLSVTGSLATLLWLVAIRREGENVTAWQFLRVGVVAMPIALAASLGALYLQKIAWP